MRRSFKRTLSYSRRGRSAMYSRRSAARSLQLRAYRGAQAFRSLQSAPRHSTAEVKSVDTVSGDAAGIALPLNTSFTRTAMNLLQEGSGFYNRIGRRIEMQSLHLTGLIHQTGTVTTQDDYGRILVVYDRQTNGAMPPFSTIMSDYDQAGSSATTVFSGLNPDQRERFVILADIRLALPATTSAGLSGAVDGVNTTFNINRFIKLRNLNTHYQNSSQPSVIGDISTGGLYIVTCGALASGDEGWQFQAKWRLRYKDT